MTKRVAENQLDRDLAEVKQKCNPESKLEKSRVLLAHEACRLTGTSDDACALQHYAGMFFLFQFILILEFFSLKSFSTSNPRWTLQRPPQSPLLGYRGQGGRLFSQLVLGDKSFPQFQNEYQY